MNRLFTLGCIVLGLSSAAMGQDWARARLDKSPRHQEWVTVRHDGRAIQCFVVYPEVKNKAPAVLVIHEIFGLSDWARGMVDQLAAQGYIAIAPDLVSGLAAGGGGTAEFSGRDAVIKAVSGLPPKQVLADLDATLNYIEMDPACNGHLAVVGFCWGGGKSFLMATHRADLKAAFVFYGPPPPAEAMEAIRCPVYGFYAGDDARISATVPETKEQMKADGKKYEAVIYDGAGHGFMRAGEDPEGTEGNKKAREEGWKRLKGLLKDI